MSYIWVIVGSSVALILTTYSRWHMSNVSYELIERSNDPYVFLIGIISKYFADTFFKRMSGATLGAVIFFIVTNFGVWISGMYGYYIKGFITCYPLAIQFFAYSVISTLIFSSVIEIFYKTLPNIFYGYINISMSPTYWFADNFINNL